MSDHRARLLDGEGFNQLARTRDGYCLYNRNDRYVGPAIATYGEFSAHERDFLLQLCAPGDVVFEAGANIGAHTVELARRVGPRGAVFAFEPQRVVFQALCANVAINSLANVYCHWAALGEAEGRIEVPYLDPALPQNFGGLSLGGGSERAESVACLTLDRYLDLPRLRLVKIDVEGMERAVIRGGQRLLAKFKPLLYVENDRVEHSESLMRLLDGLGYDLHWHRPPLYSKHNFYGVAENIFPGLASFNLLGVHRDNRLVRCDLPKVTDFSVHPLRR
jgi:FkbM family methyltransferase